MYWGGEMSINMMMGIIIVFIIIAFFVINRVLLKKTRSVYENFIKDKLKEQNELYDSLEDSVVVIDHSDNIVYINQSMVSLMGFNKREIPKKFDMPDTVDQDGVFTSLKSLVQDIKINPYKFIIKYGRLNLYIKNKKISTDMYISRFYDMDIVSKQQVRIILFRTLRHDKDKEVYEHRHKLTKLPNHIKFQKDLESIYVKLHLKEKRIALITMEIDNFSSLRAIIGYEQTNNILISFANYLNELSQEFHFSVYHTMHNSFILLIEDVHNTADIYSVVNLIQNKLQSLYKMENSILHLTVSVGIAVYPDNSLTGELVGNSYKALAMAEQKGHGWVQMYQNIAIEHGYDELKLYNDMHLALDRNEFEIYYQPIIDAHTRHIVSAEALVRWKHPEFGMVRPDVFIHIMEKTGFITKLGKYLLEEVIKQQKRWEVFKFNQIPISINLSLAELETEKFIQTVKNILETHNVSPRYIKYEITEGLAMENEERIHKQLTQLHSLGIDILLDDFGTGYTSFSYLKKIPADIIKIDKSLVDNILTSKTDQGITKSIIDLAHSIGLKVTVEGIEDEFMLNMLRDMGADYIQGFYISKPVPVFEFQKFLRK